jgi:hypothetical protein
MATTNLNNREKPEITSCLGQLIGDSFPVALAKAIVLVASEDAYVH